MLEGNRVRSLATAAIVTLSAAHTVAAQTVTSPGYIYSFVALSDTTQSCVAIAPGGAFVGQGPGFTGNAQSVVFVTDSGDERTVVSGFNSMGDCVYDAEIDVLYVVDNALEASGAVTGDTAYAIPDALSASGLTASAFKLLPDGSIPSAFSVALDSAGDVFVSDAAGGGNGSVRKIKISNGALTTFVGGFDFAGGIIFDASGDLLVADSLDSFETQISRFSSTGVFEDVVSGPGDDHGSFDLVFNTDGRLLVTGDFGGPVASLNAVTGAQTSLASGFSFATSIDVDDFTGRVGLVSSTFSGFDEDFRLHLLTPIALMVPDGGSGGGLGDDRRECVSELYGIELATNPKGKTTKKAVCTDGAACDADGVQNDSCTFPLGVCLNVLDERIPHCFSDLVTFFELKKAKPDNAALSALAADVADALPSDGPQCFFSDGVAVAVRMTAKGDLKPGTQQVKFKSKRESPLSSTDVDAVKLVCEPAIAG